MPKNEGEPTTRTHIHIFTRDKERVEALFGHNIGYSKAIRLMIRSYLETLESKALINAKRPEVSDAIMSDLLKSE